jgi:uncharacterized integral membrane protein
MHCGRNGASQPRNPCLAAQRPSFAQPEPSKVAGNGMAIASATVVGYTFFRDTRIHGKATDGTFFIPGSWVPLVVMMAIFFAKYVNAVMHAFNAAVIATPLFIGALSAVYGLLSGYFSSRAVNLIKLAQKV